MPKYKIDSSKYLEDFIHDLHSNDCIIKAFVADNLKRANAREAQNHASYYACEYCFSKALTFMVGEEQLAARKHSLEQEKKKIEERIETLQQHEHQDEESIQALQVVLESLNNSLKNIQIKKKQLVWPYSTSDGEPRTREKIIEIVNQIEEGNAPNRDDRKGIVGKSPFLTLEYFDIVLDIPCEYLHSGCIGVVKRLVCLTFNVGITRTRITTRKLTPPSVFNLLMAKIKVVREFGRRARNLDFSVFKAQEYRNLALFFFPIIVDCIEEEAKERRLWLLLAYLLRACVIPQHEFQNVNISDIDYCAKHFYKLYEQLFGPSNCSYNTHIIGAHIKEMRIHGPLTLTSAFGFESFYGEMRKSFVPETASPLKQILQKIYLKRALSPHNCKPSIHITTHTTSLECNNLIYTFTDRIYKLYKVVDIQNEILNCVRINVSEVFYEETPNLNWDLVGVFQEESIDTAVINISQKYVAGKIIKIDKMLITCPLNILDEK